MYINTTQYTYTHTQRPRNFPDSDLTLVKVREGMYWGVIEGEALGRVTDLNIILF